MLPRITAIFALSALLLGSVQVISAQSDSTESDLSARLLATLPQLSAAEVGELTDTGELALPYGLEPGSDVSVRLAPAFASQIESDLRALDPKIGVEVLFVVDAPPGMNGVDHDVMTTLQSISTMEGIEYYSASRERMRTLFHESYVIAGPDDRTRRPDPVVESTPQSDLIHIFQRDSSFGRNVLEVTYTIDEGAVRLRMRNLTRMLYQGIIPAVGPQALGLNLVVVPLGERLLFYGNSAARPISLLGMEARVQRSFYNRLVALYRWFLDQSG
ncbi:MAG: DUF6675 family protein [Spirochaetota bacterium]